MSTDRRGFLARLGAVATAPVLTAFVTNDQTGLAVPDRRIETAPSPMLISSLTGPPPGFARGDIMRAPDGSLVVYVDGEAWSILAYRLGARGRP